MLLNKLVVEGAFSQKLASHDYDRLMLPLLLLLKNANTMTKIKTSYGKHIVYIKVHSSKDLHIQSLV